MSNVEDILYKAHTKALEKMYLKKLKKVKRRGS